MLTKEQTTAFHSLVTPVSNFVRTEDRRLPLNDGMALGSNEPERKAQKNREVKEGPTILLITKDRSWEPTIFMKMNIKLTQAT